MWYVSIILTLMNVSLTVIGEELNTAALESNTNIQQTFTVLHVPAGISMVILILF